MARIKSYTSLEQSKKLAKILPIESADMGYAGEEEDSICCGFGDVEQELYTDYGDGHPCWSLMALIECAKQLCTRFEITVRADKKFNIFAAKHNFRYLSWDEKPEGIDNLVDALCELIPRLPAEGGNTKRTKQ